MAACTSAHSSHSLDTPDDDDDDDDDDSISAESRTDTEFLRSESKRTAASSCADGDDELKTSAVVEFDAAMAAPEDELEE